MANSAIPIGKESNCGACAPMPVESPNLRAKNHIPWRVLTGKNFGYKQIRSAICRALLICYVI